MAKTYYKVVRRNGSKALMVSSWHVSNQCFYIENTWTHANRASNGCTTKLFVFDNLYQALAYKESMGNRGFEIWECSVKNPTRTTTRGVLYSSDTDAYWSLYNKFKKMKKSVADIQNRIGEKLRLSDINAILVDAVKLTKKVEYKQ